MKLKFSFLILCALGAFLLVHAGDAPSKKLNAAGRIEYEDYPETLAQVVITTKQVVNDYQCIPAPGNPPPGNVRVYCDSSTGLFTCKKSSGASCNSVGAPAGASTNVQYNDAGVFGGDANFTWDKTTRSLAVNSIFATTPAGSGITLTAGLAGNAEMLIGNGALTGGIDFDVFDSGDINMDAAAGGISALATGDINIRSSGGLTNVGLAGGVSGEWKYIGKTSGNAIWGVADAAGTPNPVNFPTATGSNGQFLKTDGGSPQQTSWATPTLPTTTATNCSSAASPAICGSAQAGSVVIAAGATTVTVNTTAVTANSQILVFPDETLGTKLSVTCNSTLATAASGLAITARTAATSFRCESSVLELFDHQLRILWQT